MLPELGAGEPHLNLVPRHSTTRPGAGAGEIYWIKFNRADETQFEVPGADLILCVCTSYARVSGSVDEVNLRTEQ